MAKLDETTVRLATLKRLLEAGRELHDKMTSILEEMDAVAGGGAGMAQQLKTFRTAFDEAWGSRYAGGQTGRYLWRSAVDVPNMKRILKSLGLEEALARMTRYIANDDGFLVRSRHPFGLFVSGINSYAGAPAPAEHFNLEAPTVADCKHTPRCVSDQAHTDRKMRELLA